MHPLYRWLAVGSVAGFLSFSLAASAQVLPGPNGVNVQGRLTGAGGSALPDGPHTITLSLWDALIGGTQTFTQTLTGVTVTGGLFSTQITTLTPSAVNGTLWVQVQVDADPPMTPRLPFTSVASALKANTVPDASIASTQLASDAGSLTKVSAGAMTSDGTNLTTKANADLHFGDNGQISSMDNNHRILFRRSENILELREFGDIVLSPGASGGMSTSTVVASASGNVGVGTTTPAAKLDVNGTVQMTGFKMPEGAGVNELLTSDASGNGTWTPLSFGTVGGTIGATQIAAGSLTGDKLATATISMDKLATSMQYPLSMLTTIGVPSNNPVLLGTVSTNGYPTSVAVLGNTAYVVSTGTNILQAYDVSNPYNPVAGVSAATHTSPRGVAGWDLGSGHANVGIINGDSTYQEFSTNATSIVLTNTAATQSNPVSIAVNDAGSVFVVNSVSKTLQELGSTGKSVATIGTPSSVAVSGNMEYVVSTGGTAGTLEIYEDQGPALKLDGSAATTSNPTSVAVAGNYAYVVGSDSSNNGTLDIFDVSAPATPIRRGRIATGNRPASVTVSGGFALVVNAMSSTLQVFDVSNPFSPVLRGSAATGANPACVTVSGIYAYVANNGGRTLQVFSFEALLAVNGNLQVKGSGTFAGPVLANAVTLTSDARYKTNVATLDNALDDVLNMRGVSYDWDRARWPEKRFPDGRQVGFIAQELEQVLPELVSTDSNGFKSVAYQNVVPVLVEAVKTLKAENDQLRTEKDAQIASLEQRMKRMEERLDRVGASGQP